MREFPRESNIRLAPKIARWVSGGGAKSRHLVSYVGEKRREGAAREKEDGKKKLSEGAESAGGSQTRSLVAREWRILSSLGSLSFVMQS